MQIKLNNRIEILTEQLTVQQLMDLAVEEQKGVALAVNHVVVPRSDWQHHVLYENDDVLIIKATQGG
jgi:sulfur carrier protein